MAVNLRSKLDPEYTLLMCDVSEGVIEKFQRQMNGEGPVEVVQNGFEAVKRAVGLYILSHYHDRWI